jgi:hypothetical protein
LISATRQEPEAIHYPSYPSEPQDRRIEQVPYSVASNKTIIVRGKVAEVSPNGLVQELSLQNNGKSNQSSTA